MRTYWSIFLGLWWSALAAQTPAYLHYTVRDGLPGNLVYCGLQDRRGLLWFGTDKGLACFDGIRFRTYGVADGLPDPEVLNMQEDSKGRLWLFCFRKKPCYMFDGQIFTEQQDSMLAKLDFNTGTYILSEESKDKFWLTELSRGCYYIEKDQVVHRSFSELLAFFQKMEGTFFGFGLHSIIRVDPDGNAPIVWKSDKTYLYNSCKISGNRILYSFNIKLVLLEYKNGQFREVVQLPKPSGQLFADRFGRFWVCSAVDGAILFDNDQRDLSNPVTYLPGKKVHRMFEDNQGTLWFCMANEGIYALQNNAPVTFQQEAGFNSLNIRSLALDESGQLLVGDDAGVVRLLEGDTVKYNVPIGADDGYNQIRQIIPYGKGTFWAATDEGLHLFYDQYRQRTRYAIKHSLKAVTLLRDTIWAASSGALINTPVNSTQLNRVIAQRRSTAVETDSENNIWAGGVDGLFSRRDSFQLNWGDRFPVLKNRIMTIRKAGNNRLWVVTPRDGLLLVQVRNGAVTGVDVINERLKKPIENIQALFMEPNGKVWLATNRGVYGVDRNWNVVHFDSNDGLAADDVNAILIREDTLWAGTVSGLTRMVLRPPNEKEDFPTLVVDLHCQKGNQTLEIRLLDSMADKHQVLLPPDISNLELNLAGLDYLSRGNLRFEVIQTNLLLPLQWWTFDNLIAWISGGFEGKKDTSLTETGAFNFGAFVPAGKYRVQVTAIKASDIRSRHPDTWTILKKPYWYESFWLYLFLWFVLGYGIYRIYRARVAYKEMNAAASVLQLQALQSQMNPHFIGNTVNAIQQFLHPPDPIKTSEYIALFMRLLRRTMDFSEQTFIPFEEELSYDQEYLQLVHLRFENKFRYEISGAEQVPPDTPVPSMLLQPVLENATIHGIAPEGISVLKLEFFYDGRQFRCVLTDNGIGMGESHKQKLTSGIERKSKGLYLLHKKVSTLNNLYDIDLVLAIDDLAARQTGEQGTRITITYNPDKIWKAIKKRSAPATASGRSAPY